jgi:predicted TIM-barrel fold metal-dependent hydrolase
MHIDPHQHFWRYDAARDSDWRGTDAFVCQPSGQTGATRYSRRSALRPVCLLAGSYDRVKGLAADFVRGRPEAEQSKILGETAARYTI